MEALLAISPEDGIDLAAFDGAVYVISSMKPKKLYPAHEIYIQSVAVAKHSKFVKRETLEQLIAEKQLRVFGDEALAQQDIALIILPVEPRIIAMTCILGARTPADTLAVLDFCDQFLIDTNMLAYHEMFYLWLGPAKLARKVFWTADVIANVEQSIFDSTTFPDVEAPPAQPANDDDPYLRMRGWRRRNADYPDVPYKRPERTEIDIDDGRTNIDPAELRQILELNTQNLYAQTILVNIMLSPDHYHLVMNNTPVLSVAAGYPIFQRTLGYTLRMGYLKELSIYQRKEYPTDNRATIPLSAQWIESIPTNKESWRSSPYNVSRAKFYRFGLLLPIFYSGRVSRGIHSAEDTKRLIGKYTSNIFKGAQWSSPGDVTVPKYSMALCGSAIPACVIRTPSFSEEVPFDKYGGTDVTTTKQFNARNIFARRVTTPEVAESSAPKASSSAPNADEPAEDRLEYKNFGDCDIDLMVECDFDNFDKVVEHIFANMRKNSPGITLRRVDTENKYKYFVDGLNREIDIFHVNSIPAVIAKFHLGCVRAWYDGEEVWAYPSFITAAMLGVNVDVRWTSNLKDVRDTILKYYQREFATLLTHTNVKNIINYSDDHPIWPHGGRVVVGWREKNAPKSYAFGSAYEALGTCGIHMKHSRKTSCRIDTFAKSEKPRFLLPQSDPELDVFL